MDGFHDDHKGHMIFAHATSSESGSWVGLYTVWALNDHAALTSVLHGTAQGTYPSIKFATTVAWDQAKRRIDALLEMRDYRAAAALRPPRRPDISEFRNY
jgi:hypothetical protein